MNTTNVSRQPEARRPKSIAGPRIALALLLPPLLGAIAAGFAPRVHAQALTPGEAEAAYVNAQPPKLEPGCYRSSTRGEVSYQQIFPDGRVFRRTEMRLKRPGKPPLRITRITIQNDEGKWTLYEDVAVLEPTVNAEAAHNELFEEFSEGRNMMGAMEESFKSELGELVASMPSDPEQAKALLRPVWSGERFTQENGAPGLLVRETPSEHSIRLQHAVLDAMVKATPFFVRGLMRGFVERGKKSIPYDREHMIDVGTNRIILTREISRDGKLVSEKPPTEWTPCDPAGFFEIPQQVEKLRPKSPREAMRLNHKHEERAWKEAAKRQRARRAGG